jgi:hypothetical protein
MHHNRRTSLPIGPGWLADETSKRLTTQGAQTTGHFMAFLIENPHGLIGLKLSSDVCNSNQKQGGTFVAQRLAGTTINF